MKTIGLLILITTAVIGRIQGQLYTRYAYPSNLDTLVLTNFSGSGVQISNVQFTGFNLVPSDPIKDIGFFNAQNTSLGIDSGIILASGYLNPPYGLGQPASVWENDIKYTNGDSLLDVLIDPNWTVNAVILEFDFVPNGDSVKFNYVFASEEYNHDVCNTNNDVFAFHISGPGIFGNQNIATIPGTNLPVSINSVNNGSPGIAWTPSGCISLSYPQYFVDRNNDTNLIFNGSTSLLTAVAPTIPCQTYHLRFAIADGFSTYENSAVFLAANSFNSNPISITPSVSYGGPDTLLYEGCGYATLVIRRTYNLQQAKTYTINYSGAAIYGTDYTASPLQITMQPGQMYDTIQIYPAADMISDNGETLLISIGDTLCNGEYFVSDITLIINEKQGLTVNIAPDTGSFCDTVTFLSEIIGAIPPVQYNWNNGASTDSSFTFFMSGTQTIILQASDACGQSAQDTATVKFGFYPTADFSYDPDYADLLSSTIYFYDLSTSDVTEWIWSFGSEENNSTIQNPIYFYSEPDSYMVSLVVATDIGCMDSISKPIIVHEIPTLYIPNSFTPNDDLVNDVFQVYGNEISYFKMRIFNRWGEEIFNTNDIDQGWNGAYNGVVCEQAEYVVYIEFAFNHEPEKIYLEIENLSLIK